MRQHQVEGACTGPAHFSLDRIDAHFADVFGPGQGAWHERGRELLFAFIDPVDHHVQRRQRAGNRPAHMAGPVELQVKQRRRHGPGRQGARIEARESQRDGTAATLAECRPERVVRRLRRCVASGQHGARLGDGLEFQVPAADRADSVRRAHQHACASFSRRRPERFGHRDQNGLAVRRQPVRCGAAQVTHRGSIAVASPTCR